MYPFRRKIPVEQSAAHKLWNLLQEEENRSIPLKALCCKAGYRSMSPWYVAIKDENFRARVQSLGIAIWREAPHSPTTTSLTEDPDEEWRKDHIDVRRLVAAFPRRLGAEAFQLDFSCIGHPGMRDLVKRYFRARVGSWKSTDFHVALEHMKPFFWALSESYPEAGSFTSFTRSMMEPLLLRTSWTDRQGHVHCIPAGKESQRLSHFRAMFVYMQEQGWEGAPRHLFISHDHRLKPGSRRSNLLPPMVLEQLRKYWHGLSVYAQTLIIVLTETGLRPEDALHLRENCLQYDAENRPHLHWYDHLLLYDGYPHLVTVTVAEALQRQQDLVKTLPDYYNTRYLFRTPKGLYRLSVFCQELNTLAIQAHLLGEDGKVYRFAGSQFQQVGGTRRGKKKNEGEWGVGAS